jgi:hypothetical protein
MLPGNTLEFLQMAPRLVPEVLDAVNMTLLVCKEFGVVDATVLEFRYIQHIVALPAI